MSYVLFLGFKCTVYKKPPTVRVSLNDIFLDEFSIVPKSICNLNEIGVYSNYAYEHCAGSKLLNPNLKNYTKFYSKDMAKFVNKDILFCAFEVSENIWQENTKLKIEIINQDNNYTNGFLTKSTMVSLCVVQLIPKIALINPINFYNEYMNKVLETKKTQLNADSIKNMYRKKLHMFNVCDYTPTPIVFYNSVTNKIEKKNPYEWIGTSGYFQFPIKEKFHSIIIDPNIVTFDEIFFLFLSHKYNHYAN